MRTTPPIYRYSGLIAGLGLLALLIGLIIFVVNPGLQIASWLTLALGVLLLALAFIVDFRKVSGAVTGKRGRFSTGTTVMVFVFIGITLLVNAISIGNYKRFDITELSQFTLTSQTKDVLGDMETSVEAICFFTPNDPYGVGLDAYATSLLEEYQNYTELLTVKIIDPDEHPDEARKYNISQYQTIVFESEIGRRMVSPQDMIITSSGQIVGIEVENPFTSAILEVTGISQKTIYFLTGHGEATISGEYAYARQGLLDNLYKVNTLDLMVYQGIPEDCTALVIAAPQRSLTALEYDIIEKYLENDGWLLVLLNPGSPDDIKQLLSAWWIDIEDGTVIDPSAYVSPNMDSPLIPRTSNEFGLTETYFPGAASIIPQEEYPDNVFLLPLFYTSATSWMEKDFDPLEEPVFNKETEQLGSRALGVLMTFLPPEEETEGDTTSEEMRLTRLVVVGDSDFASNQHFYNAENGYLFLSLIELVTSGEQLISIERKVLPYRSLVLAPEEETFIQVSSIGLLPLLVLVVGGVIWWRRR